MKLALIYLLVITLAGCATAQPPVVKYVEAPRTPIVVPAEPHYPIEDLRVRTLKESRDDSAASFELSIGYIDQLLLLLKPLQ